MRNMILCTVILLTGFSTGLYAQTGTVEGTVTDGNTGETMPGVNVVVQETTSGTTTNADGEYSLEVDVGEVVVFSYVGYEPQTVQIDNGHLEEGLDVIMVSAVAAMDEMVVVGFGTQRRANVTGAVSTVSGEEIEQRPVTNTALALQGVTPGLTIMYEGGQPGEQSAEARIRGIGTLNDHSPLVLVDGVEQSLATIEPETIESISVLKDAASAAIYGSRAANGVILITTKRGAETGINISYDNHIGWQNRNFFPEPADKESWLRLENEAQVNAGGSPTFSEEYIQNVVAGTNPLQFPFADWEGGIFNDNALEHRHSLSVSSGGQTGRIFASMNYTDSDGIIQNFGYQRFSLRLNTDLFLSDNVTLVSNLLYRNRDVSGPGWPAQQIVQGLLHMNRNVVMRYPDGTYDLIGGQWNPHAMANHGETSRISNDIVGKIGLSWQITPALSVDGDFTVNTTGTNESIFQDGLQGMRNYFTGELTPVSGWFATPTLNERRFNETELSQRLYLNLAEDLGNHNIEALVGYEEIYNDTEQISAGRDNFFSNDLRSISAGDVANQSTGGYVAEWRIRSFFGRANYTFNDRYTLQANLRYDGSSRFGDGNRWGLFPSFSAGWRITSEEFMQSLETLSNLRLRASWGQLGNERLGTPGNVLSGLYRYLNTYNLNQGYQFGGAPVSGAAVTQAGNPAITWETTTMTNVGLDVGLFDDRLEIVAEYFWNYTDDILLDLPIPATVGVSPPTQNAAEVSNRGWEVAVNYRSVPRIDQGFQYSVGINFSDVVNRIESLRGAGPFYPDNFTVWAEGHSINSLRGFRSPGLYRTEEDFEQYPTVYNPNVTIGDIIYEDLNSDGSIDAALYPVGDQYIMGNEDPRYEFGVNFNASWRGFDFGMFWQGVLKQQHSLDGALNEGPNWQNFIPEIMARETFHPVRNPDGTWPLVTAGNTWNLVETDFWLQDTKYLRLKNFQLGYTVPQTLINSLRVYVSGENMLTFTPTELFDPETPRGRSQFFPHTRLISVGVNVRL